jgi:hypothetical protein
VVDAFPMLLGAFPDLRIRPFNPPIETRPRVLLSNTRPTSLITGMFVDTLKVVAEDLVESSRLLLKSPVGLKIAQ